MASDQNAIGHTTVESFDPGAETNTPEATGGKREEPTLKPDGTSEQAPLGHTGVKFPEPGAPTTIPGAAGGKPSSNPVPYDDDEFNTKVKDTETQVVESFQKAFSHLERPIADTTTQGTGGRAFKNRSGDDDTIENQMRNTTAQVVGTFKGLSSAFHEAGQKIRGGVKNTDSSDTAVGK